MTKIPSDPTNPISRPQASSQATELNFDPKTVATTKELTEKFGHTGTIFGTPTKNVKQCIYAYAPNKKALKDIPDEYNGLKIIKKVTGKTRPA